MHTLPLIPNACLSMVEWDPHAQQFETQYLFEAEHVDRFMVLEATAEI